ncbi:MAG: lysylphosphatidylglycerol synthase domain-containing protein [Pyrinomonadaceae bacterium]
MSTIDETLRPHSHSDHLTHSEEITAGRQAKAGRRGGRTGGRSMFWLQFVAFLLGLSLLIFIIKKVGVQPIFDALLRIGFGFFIVLGFGGVRHAFRTLSMRIAVPPEHRRFHFLQGFSARLGGEAISFLTFTGPLLGEATKLALLRKRVPLVYGLPALVIDNLLYNLSVGLFVLSGACVLLAVYPLPQVVFYLLIGIAVVSASSLVVVGIAVSRRMMPLSTLLSSLARLGLNRRMIVSRRKQVRRIESNVYEFYRTRRKSFLAMLMFNGLAHVSSVAEVYVTLKLLNLSASVACSLCYRIAYQGDQPGLRVRSGDDRSLRRRNGIDSQNDGFRRRDRCYSGVGTQSGISLLDRCRPPDTNSSCGPEYVNTPYREAS